jgi:hypothetical protein
MSSARGKIGIYGHAALCRTLLQIVLPGEDDSTSRQAVLSHFPGSAAAFLLELSCLPPRISQ